MHIKTTMRHPLVAIRKAAINGEDAEKSESLCTVTGNVKWCRHY